MKTLIKILCLSVLLLNIGYSVTEYLPNFPIEENLNGINFNLTRWKWHPNESEIRDDIDFSENWFHLSYYINRKYSINMIYVNYINNLSDLTDRFAIEACYNKIIFKKLISRNALAVNDKTQISFNSTISFENKFITDLLKFNYLLGFNYSFSDSEFKVRNCFTLSLPLTNNTIEYFISYWREGKRSSDLNYIGIGINIFIN